MGLLSDPERVNFVLNKLKRWKAVIGFLGYLSGLCGIFLLASDDISPRTYFSENALLPASVETHFYDTRGASNLYQETKLFPSMTVSQRYDWIKKQMLKAGLDVYYQNFSINYKVPLYGVNVYGVLQSQRTSGVEALVLHTSVTKDGTSNGGLAVMISLANYFRQQTYWAKSLIFLVTDHNSYGVKAWLNGYHGQESEGISHCKLTGFAGAIQAALTLDIETDSVDELQVFVEGSNGLLPNLDLVNLIFRVANAESLNARLHTEKNTPESFEYTDMLLANMKNLFTMIATQASGFPSGIHGDYFHYRIEAVTIKGLNKGRHSYSDFFHISRAVESIFRSLNSLLEHFHQSFFFYLLANHYGYISIGLYMIPLGLLLLGPVLNALCLWSDTVVDSLYARVPAEVYGDTHKESSMLTVIFVPFLSHLLGFLTFDKLCNADSPYLMTVTSASIICITVSLMIRLLFPSLRERQWKARNLFATVYFILVVVTLSMLNFSLGFITAAAWTPLVMIIQGTCSKLYSTLQLLIAMLVAPPTLLLLMCLLYRVIALQEPMSYLCFEKGLEQANWYLEYAIKHQYMGIWTLKLTTVILWPLWVQLATIR